MKKFVILLICVCLLLCSCNAVNNYEDQTDKSTQATDRSSIVDSQEVNITATAICIKNTQADVEVSLQDNQISQVLSIWNESEWHIDTLKVSCPYSFVIDNSYSIHYAADVGVFNDYERNLSITISEEQREFINSIIE